MCGIAGALARRPDERPPARAVELAAAAMVHRGPDGFGFFTTTVPSRSATGGSRSSICRRRAASR